MASIKWTFKHRPKTQIKTQVNLTAMYINFLHLSFPDLASASLDQTRYNLFLLAHCAKTRAKVSRTRTSRNPVYNNFLFREFKLNYKVNNHIKRAPQPTNTPATFGTDGGTSVHLLHSFKSYLYLNSASQNALTLPHFSFRQFYLGHRKGGLAVLNVRKLFSRWKESYFFMFNLFYYELELLTFGSSFFKREILALNWQVLSSFKFMWRYTRPFFWLKSNKITTHGDFVFYRLNLLGLKLGLVIDILYHNKTIYYLHRSGFYTLGLVPINYNINSLDFAIPYTSDSVLSQAFFIRFLTLTQQNVSTSRYDSLKQAWLLKL